MVDGLLIFRRSHQMGLTNCLHSHLPRITAIKYLRQIVRQNILWSNIEKRPECLKPVCTDPDCLCIVLILPVWTMEIWMAPLTNCMCFVRAIVILISIMQIYLAMSGVQLLDHWRFLTVLLPGSQFPILVHPERLFLLK